MKKIKDVLTTLLITPLIYSVVYGIGCVKCEFWRAGGEF